MAILLNKEIPLRQDSWPSVVFSGGDALAWQGDLLVVGLHEDAVKGGEQEAMGALDGALDGILREFVDLEHFTGELGSSLVTRRGSDRTRLVGVVGLGPADPGLPWGPSAFRMLGEQTAALAKAHSVGSAAVALLSPVAADNDVAVPRRHEHAHDHEKQAGDLALGLLIGGFKCTRFRSTPAPQALQQATVFSFGSNSHLEAVAEQAVSLAQGVSLARHLQEAPANVCTPAYLVNAAFSIAAAAPDVMQLQVLDTQQCASLGMGCFLAVGAASTNEPHFIHLKYTPKASHQALRRVALVGKSVCFDTGGYNLKVNMAIEMMKIDMSGGAAVLGAAEALSHIKPEGVEVHFILAATENMIDGKGYRPSDVVSASNGKTVEVVNTDAEGRLALADSLVYAEKLGVEAIVDIATLTGAGFVALGPGIGGMFTDSTQLAGDLRLASQAAGERIWQMPLERTYLKENKSAIADLRNYPTGKGGGSIAAALFLREFVSDKVKWAHFDAAGPMFDMEQQVTTGWGALTLTHWVLSMQQAHTTAVFGFQDIPPSPPKQPPSSEFVAHHRAS